MAQKIVATRGPCKKARVKIEGVKGSFKAYVENGSWNGFAEPFFTKEEGLRLSKGLSADKEHNVQISYWPSRDAFVEKWEGEHYPYKAMHVQTVDGVKKLYPIGNSVWTWEIIRFGW